MIQLLRLTKPLRRFEACKPRCPGRNRHHNRCANTGQSCLFETWSRIGVNGDFGIEVATSDDGTEPTEAILQLGSRINCFLEPCDAPSWRETCSVAELRFCSCMVAVPKHHPLSDKTSLSWEDLSGQSIMLVKKRSSLVLDTRSNAHSGFASLAVNWTYRAPFGLICSKAPSAKMELFAEELAGLAETSE